MIGRPFMVGVDGGWRPLEATAYVSLHPDAEPRVVVLEEEARHALGIDLVVPLTPELAALFDRGTPPVHSVEVADTLRVPVVAPSGARPATVRRVHWAAARRLDTLRRRRRRRRGLPAHLRIDRTVYFPAARVQAAASPDGLHVHVTGPASEWWR